MPHDCWYCKFNRYLLVVGMLALAAVLFIAAVNDAFHAKWLMALKELIGITIPLFGAWFGLRVLRAIPVFFDRIWLDYPPKQ